MGGQLAVFFPEFFPQAKQNVHRNKRRRRWKLNAFRSQQPASTRYLVSGEPQWDWSEGCFFLGGMDMATIYL